MVTLAHVLDAELWIIAVHDCYVVSFHVIQVTRHQHGECCFTSSSLLGGEGDEQRFFFHSFFSFNVVNNLLSGRHSGLPVGLSVSIPAGRLLRLLVGLPVLRLSGRLASRKSGKPAGRTVGLSDDRLVSRPFCPQSKGHFFQLVSFPPLVAACGSKWQGMALPASTFNSRLPSDRFVGWLSDSSAVWLVGQLACLTAGWSADLSACKVKGILATPYRFWFWWQLVAASGREWLRFPHVFR